MINIDFEKAYRIANGLGELGADMDSLSAATKGIDASRVSEFCPRASGLVDKMQSSVSNISGVFSTFSSNYTSSIDKYYNEYLETGASIDQLLNTDGTYKTRKYFNPGDGSYKVLGTAYNGKMLIVEYGGEKFYVPNTRRLCFDYQKHVMSEGLYESANNHALDNNCKTISKIYAFDLMSYKRNPHTLDTLSAYNASGRFQKTLTSPNLSDIQKFIYNEATAGRPTTLTVTGGPGGHMVTVVGFSADVKSPSDINANTILVLDNYNGNLTTLSQCTEQGRDILKVNGKYYEVTGATDKYLAEINDYYREHPEALV